MLLLAALLLPSIMQPLPTVMPFYDVVKREKAEEKKWQSNIEDLRTIDEVNQYWNHVIKYTSDQEQWNALDHWSTPEETFEKGKGDCEDYAIAKYYTLRHLGWKASRLKVTFLISEKAEFHVVLVVDESILDNRTDKIIPISQSVYAQSGYSVNERYLWMLK